MHRLRNIEWMKSIVIEIITISILDSYCQSNEFTLINFELLH